MRRSLIASKLLEIAHENSKNKNICFKEAVLEVEKYYKYLLETVPR